MKTKIKEYGLLGLLIILYLVLVILTLRYGQTLSD